MHFNFCPSAVKVTHHERGIVNRILLMLVNPFAAKLNGVNWWLKIDDR